MALSPLLMNEHRFEHCRVVINVTARWLSTTFSDGAELIAAPNMDTPSRSLVPDRWGISAVTITRYGR